MFWSNIDSIFHTFSDVKWALADTSRVNANTSVLLSTDGYFMFYIHLKLINQVVMSFPMAII